MANKAERKDHINLTKVLQDVSKLEVYVGIPASRSSRKGEKINNAELLYIHTNGSERMGIPPRPVIEPAIEARGNKEPIAEQLGLAAKSVLAGKKDEAKKHLKLAGQTGENAARNWFTDSRNGWPPNTPATIKEKGSDRPLIDTSALRKSITHVVKEK